MAVWLVTAGQHGEYEAKFIAENRVFVTGHDLKTDLQKRGPRSELDSIVRKLYPDTKPRSGRWRDHEFGGRTSESS